MISIFRSITILETQVIGNSSKPLCEVCKEPAGKHNYYGGKVCPSCRAFFRRAVQNRYYEIFMCTTKLKNCIVNLQTRKSCQYCRFQKCLNAGMKTAWVLPDGERTKRYNKLLKNGFVKNDNGTISKPQTQAKFLTQQLSLEEAMLIGALVKDWSTKCMESIHMYKPFYVKIAWKAYCPMPLPYELMDNYITVCKATTSKGAKNLDEMLNIDDKDKDELFKTNAGKDKLEKISKKVLSYTSVCYQLPSCRYGNSFQRGYICQ